MKHLLLIMLGVVIATMGCKRMGATQQHVESSGKCKIS